MRYGWTALVWQTFLKLLFNNICEIPGSGPNRKWSNYQGLTVFYTRFSTPRYNLFQNANQREFVPGSMTMTKHHHQHVSTTRPVEGQPSLGKMWQHSLGKIDTSRVCLRFFFSLCRQRLVPRWRPLMAGSSTLINFIGVASINRFTTSVQTVDDWV